MKKIMSLVLSVVMLFSLSSQVFAASVDTYIEKSFPIEEDSSENRYYVSKELRQNLDIMKEIFGEKAGNRYDSSSAAVIHISEDKNSVKLNLNSGGEQKYTVLSGYFNQVEIDGKVGYVGVYEGLLSPIQGRSLALNSDGLLPVIADITFSDSEMFAVITLGYATETSNPDILFYGDYSSQIAQFSNENAEMTLSKAEETALQNDSNKEGQPLRVDGTCRYKGATSVYMGSHLAGRLSVFHANQLRNQGNMSVYVKANTNSNEVKEYIKNDLGFGSYTVMAYPDTFNISICGNHNDFHAVTNSYTPQNNSTSATISIPVYGGSVIGVQFISFDITMSKTTVTPSKYTSSSQHPNNKLSWSIYKRNGWNPGTFDGDYTTETGMTVSSTYTYEGNVTSNLSRNMTSTGSIRYEYWIMIMGNLSSYHVSTSTMSKTTYVTICP